MSTLAELSSFLEASAETWRRDFEQEAKRHQEEDDRKRQALREHFRKWKFTDEAAELEMKRLNAELLARWPK